MKLMHNTFWHVMVLLYLYGILSLSKQIKFMIFSRKSHLDCSLKTSCQTSRTKLNQIKTFIHQRHIHFSKWTAKTFIILHNIFFFK